MPHGIRVEGGGLVWASMDLPEPGPGEVRIAVQAAGINRADLSQRAGRYPPPPGASPILGLECAGVIDAVGPDTPRWSVGDPVCALLAGGGYATHVVAPGAHCVALPPGCTAIEAAAVVEAFATAWQTLMWVGGLQGRNGASVVLHAGASGVGTAAVQLCRVFGHHSFVTVGSDAKIARAMELGASGGHNRHEGPWLDAVKAWRPEGVDLILDPVGKDYLAPNTKALARDGAVVHIGLLSGRSAELDLGLVLVKRLRLLGSTLRARPDAYKAQLMAALERELWPRFADGSLVAILDRTFPIADAAQAHTRLASNETVGALVLEV